MLPTSYIDGSAHVHYSVKVWHFAVILRGAEIGKNSSIGSHCEIGRGTKIGEATRISKGVFLPSNSVIGNNVFIGPNVTFTDDKYPRAGNTSYDARPPIVEDGASIGAGAVILPGVRIGANSLVGAGAIVTKDVPRGEHVRGTPARPQSLFQPLLQT